MKSHFLRKYGFLVILICFGLSFLINQIALQGARSGSSSIPKRDIYKTALDPNKYYWTNYPYALLVSLALAVIIILIGSFFSDPHKK